jgi:hypothetical protein
MSYPHWRIAVNVDLLVGGQIDFDEPTARGASSLNSSRCSAQSPASSIELKRSLEMPYRVVLPFLHKTPRPTTIFRWTDTLATNTNWIDLIGVWSYDGFEEDFMPPPSFATLPLPDEY